VTFKFPESGHVGLPLTRVVQRSDVRLTWMRTRQTFEAPCGHPSDGMPSATLPSGRLWRTTWRMAISTTGRPLRPTTGIWTTAPSGGWGGGRNGHLPCRLLEPIALWSGRPSAKDIFRTRFSRKMSNMTTLPLASYFIYVVLRFHR
jgi:hypothetical protein